jgi:hypothetical protein
VHVVAQDGVSAVIAEGPQSLLDDGRGNAGVFFQPLGDGGFEGIELAGALAVARSLWRMDVAERRPSPQGRLSKR